RGGPTSTGRARRPPPSFPAYARSPLPTASKKLGGAAKKTAYHPRQSNSRGGYAMKRSMAFAALLSAAVPFAALAQSADDLRIDEKTPGDVLVYGMGYAGQRFSPLTQINKDNVRRLVPVWAYSLSDLQGGESFPLVKDGVIYVTTHNSTAAVDAVTGRQIWRALHEEPPG